MVLALVCVRIENAGGIAIYKDRGFLAMRAMQLAGLARGRFGFRALRRTQIPGGHAPRARAGRWASEP